MPVADSFFDETLPHLGELRRTARRLVGGDLADDVVQETYLRALAARHRYRRGSNARAWLHRILANEVWTTRRRAVRDVHLARRYGAEPRSEWIDPRVPTSLGALGDRAVTDAVASLPAAYRQVLLLIDVDDLGYREAAARLGVPIGTIMSRLFRARRHLRGALGPAWSPSVQTTGDDP